NRMTAELKTGRTELESRRRYLETLLANITAGVVSTDAEGRVTTMNRAAEGLLRMSAAASVGRPIDEVFAGDGYADVRQLAAELRAGVPLPRLSLGSNGAASAPVERQLKLAREGCEVAVLLTGTRLMSETVGARGLVLFFEDVSHLLRVQRMEAWREVARRIAHEIKNPLTPIQLSAQRLRRRYAARLGPDGAPARVELATRHDTGLAVVRLELADNGAGMTPEVKARLFEPYFSTKPEGTGLGLAIVSAIVADHSGFIRVRDNLPRGSRFVL